MAETKVFDNREKKVQPRKLTERILQGFNTLKDALKDPKDPQYSKIEIASLEALSLFIGESVLYVSTFASDPSKIKRDTITFNNDLAVTIISVGEKEAILRYHGLGGKTFTISEDDFKSGLRIFITPYTS